MKYIRVIILLSLVVGGCQQQGGKISAGQSELTIADKPAEPITQDTAVQQSATVHSLPLFDLEEALAKHTEFEGYKLLTGVKTNLLQGDFFGDSIEDAAMLLTDTAEHVILGIINNKAQPSVHILGNEDDPFGIDNYSWVDTFDLVERGTVLWSNYVDDFRDFEDVPAGEKVILEYNAIYVHMAEACGGGYIFWKEDKFNWLQQE